jgi:hypothetical protein
MDYEKKYLKYKNKYNLKKSSLLGGGVIMTGGNIDAIANLVFRDVPMINRTDILLDNKIRIGPIIHNSYTLNNIEWYDVTLQKENKKTNLSINDEWEPYIQFDKPTQVHAQYDVTISFKEGINPNTPNTRGQKLLYLAAQNCNKQMFDALIALGASVTGINETSHSNILHGIAWGKVNEQDQPIKIYDEKVAFMQNILQRHSRAITLLFQANAVGETYYDNLLIRHPDKISNGLIDLAASMKRN